METIFFRLLDGVNRPSRLYGAIEKLHEDGGTADTYSAETASLRQVPGSPFAYWVSEKMRAKFTELPSFGNEERVARQGLATADDFRFLRSWWEAASSEIAHGRQSTLQQKRWVPFAKGGEFSPYYDDVHLVINWGRDGEEIKLWAGSLYNNSHWSRNIRNVDFFFRPGLTWSLRSQLGLSLRVLPAGVIFGHKGPVAFASKIADLRALLAVSNSQVFRALVSLQMAFGSYEVGVIQRTPIPDLSGAEAILLGGIAHHCIDLKRHIDSSNEVSHAVHLPALLQTDDRTLGERITLWRARVADAERRLAVHQREIDDITFQLYRTEGEDQRAIEESLSGENGGAISGDDDAQENEDSDEATAILNSGTLVADLLSYVVGCVFGRWDVRIALDPSLAPKLADPFAPLPVCSPGMLVGPDGLPAQRDGIASEEWMRARPDAITLPPDGSVENPTIPDSEYPLAVDWDGILVDDPEHEDDILRRLREMLDLLWGEHADEIEGEACDLLGVKELRINFRNPRQFFEHHIKRYSKSRRKAPIYWLLQSPKRNYGLWLYYHRLDPDILFKALHKYVEPKVRLEESHLEEYEARHRSAGTVGPEAKQAEKAVEKQEELLTDLREFRDRLERAAKLHLRPDLNDGVVLNIAPLHELVPWKEAKSKWSELLSGKYEWSSIAKQLREKGMV